VRALPEEGRSRREVRIYAIRIYAIVPRLAVRALCHGIYHGAGAARKRGGAIVAGLEENCRNGFLCAQT
jgi:hypothetical protein